MFDVFTGKLVEKQSIQYELYSACGDKPFEQIVPSSHDVFLISNSLHFTLQESQQLVNRMESIPAPFFIYKVLQVHYELPEPKVDQQSIFMK